MDNLGIFLQIMFWGLYAGCIYILLATGLNLIFGVMKIVNFAHGEFLMIGAYITATLFFLTGINPYLIILLSMLTLIGIGAVVERLCFRPILGTGKLNEIFLSIGLIYIFQNGAAMIWGDSWQSVRSPYEGITVPIGPLSVPLDYIIIMVLTVVILIALYVFLKKTKTGREMRATSQNRKGAMLVGIDVERIDIISFGLGCALAAAIHRIDAGGEGLYHHHPWRTRQHTGCNHRRAPAGYRRERNSVPSRRDMEGRGLVHYPDCHPCYPANRVIRGEGGLRDLECRTR
jgi:branched-chain amino acid transport system permease protein